jgi:hypothetical protein
MWNMLASFPGISLLTGIGIIIALCGLLISHRNYRLSSRKARAEKDAARQVANISLVVYTARVCGEGNYEPPRHFILDCQRISRRCTDLAFVVEVENLGQRTASGVSLYLRYPIHLRRGKNSEYEGPRPVTVTKEDEWEIVHFDIGDIHPGQCCQFTDHIIISDAELKNDSDTAAFQVGFRVEQRDSLAVEGDLSFGLIDLSCARPAEALKELSRLLPIGEPYESKGLRNWLLERLYRLSDDLYHKGERMIVGRSVFLLSYDKRLVTVEQNESLDRVPPKALLSIGGVQDFRGDIWIPGINARRVLMFHGKIRPEVPGRTRKKVNNLGVRRVWPYRDRTR